MVERRRVVLTPEGVVVILDGKQIKGNLHVRFHCPILKHIAILSIYLSIYLCVYISGAYIIKRITAVFYGFT